MRPLDAEEEKAQEGRHSISISDLYSVIDLHFRYHLYVLLDSNIR